METTMQLVEGVAKPAGILLTFIVSSAALWIKFKDSKTKKADELSQLIDTGVKDFEDVEIVSYLEGLKKVHFFERLIGVSLRLDQLSPLVTYLSSGQAKRHEIRVMWPHRSFDGGKLSFELLKMGWVSLWAGKILFFACAIVALLSITLYMFSQNTEVRISSLVMLIMMMVMAALSINMFWSEFTVNRINKAQKRREKVNTPKAE